MLRFHLFGWRPVPARFVCSSFSWALKMLGEARRQASLLDQALERSGGALLIAGRPFEQRVLGILFLARFSNAFRGNFVFDGLRHLA